MASAVEEVQRRLLRAAAALRAAGVPYAVAEGNAVALWVARADSAATRTTQDVDILIRRDDFAAAESALTAAGFLHRHAAGLDAFVDTPGGNFRNAVNLIFANEKVRPHEPVANPDVAESEDAGAFRILALEALVRIELTAFRDKDRVHLRDLVAVGLVGPDWLPRLPAELAVRLRRILDTPEG